MSDSEQSIVLLPSDRRVIRIAEALAEGCDGRSFASDDAKELARIYESYRSDPSISFSDCRVKAFSDFIVKVLKGTEYVA